MKPEIDSSNFKRFLFSCVEYVNYFNEIDDDFFEDSLKQLNDLFRCFYRYQSFLCELDHNLSLLIGRRNK